MNMESCSSAMKSFLAIVILLPAILILSVLGLICYATAKLWLRVRLFLHVRGEWM